MSDDVSATPSQLLALKEEREVIREGYRFLDEKRLLLAAEILRGLKDYDARDRRFADAYRHAADNLAASLERHGLDDLQVYAVAPTVVSGHIAERRLLGVRLSEAEITLEPGAADPMDPSPEADRCAAAFRRTVEQAAALAALAGNLERLLADYRRTARRARALEDVILPETDAAIRRMAAHLEEGDREEAVRLLVRANTE